MVFTALQVLDFAVTESLSLPFTAKLASVLVQSWPELRALSLSVMAKRETSREALQLIADFKQLKSLALFAPLDYVRYCANFV